MTPPKVVKVSITVRFPNEREEIENFDFSAPGENCLGICWAVIDGQGNPERENGVDVIAAFYDRIAENKGPAWARPQAISQTESAHLRDAFGSAIDGVLNDAKGQNRPWSGELIRTLRDNLGSARTSAPNTVKEGRVLFLAKRGNCNVNAKVLAAKEQTASGKSSA